MSDAQVGMLIQALAPIVGSLVTALVRWLVPQVPKFAQPLLAVAVGAATAGIGGASPEVATLAGLAAPGLREVVDRTKKAVQPVAA